MPGQHTDEDPWRLEIFWYELRGDTKDRIRDLCGELLGSVNKLAFVRAELEACLEKKDFDIAFRYVEYHVENYFTRLYALRDRIVTILCLATGLKDARELKRPETRAAALLRFEAKVGEPTRMFAELQALIDDDIKVRNTDTHESFFHIWLYDGSDVWDPPDVLFDLKHVLQREKDYSLDIERRLRELLDRFVKSYCNRIEDVVGKTLAFAQEVQGSL